jgi:hypothetical protein
MNRDTSELIRQLAADGSAIRPLARPWVRVAVWCAWSLPYLALLYLVWPAAVLRGSGDGRFIVEQVAALATAVTAAAAAFATVAPGRSRLFMLAPVLPLVVWIASIGQGCAAEWATSGGMPTLVIHWACFFITVLAGVVPAIAIVVMLRHGAPLMPRLTTAFAGIAVAGVANFGVRFVHPFDPNFVVIIWHVATVFVLSSSAIAFARHLFSWPTAIGSARVYD